MTPEGFFLASDTNCGICGIATSEALTDSEAELHSESEPAVGSCKLPYIERVSWVDIAEETEEEETARLAPWIAYAKKFCEEHTADIPYEEFTTRCSETGNRKDPTSVGEWRKVGPKRRKRR